MNRRRIRKYRTRRGNSGVKFLGITGIMIVAVICGYLTARFVIAPLLGYDTEVLKLDFPSKLVSVFGDGEETDTDTGEDSRGDKKDGNRKSRGGYALQFGLFSTRQRAEELCENLKSEGIDAEIKKVDDQYKVMSPLVDTKDEALETLKNTESDFAGDIFITRL